MYTYSSIVPGYNILHKYVLYLIYLQAVEAPRLTNLYFGGDNDDTRCLQKSAALQNVTLRLWDIDLPLAALEAVKSMTGLTKFELLRADDTESSQIVSMSSYFTGLTALRTLLIDGLLDPCQNLLQPFSSLIRFFSWLNSIML